MATLDGKLQFSALLAALQPKTLQQNKGKHFTSSWLNDIWQFWSGIKGIMPEFSTFSNLIYFIAIILMREKGFTYYIHYNLDTVFPHIVSAEPILFWILPYVLWPLNTVHTGVEIIQGRKLFKGGNYSRKYGIWTSLT